jgi:dephospho-CoA kinase
MTKTSPDINITKLLITGKMASGKSYASEYLVSNHQATRWSRTELMKPLAHALADEAGDLDDLISRIFHDEDDKAEVRRELMSYIASYDPEPGKPRRLYQDVVEICQRKDPYCFEVELEGRINSSPGSHFVIIDDVRVREAFDYFSERGFISLRINSSEEVRKKRMLARDGILPAEETLNHISETALDGLPHDFIIVNNDDNLDSFYKKLDKLVLTLRSGEIEHGANLTLA